MPGDHDGVRPGSPVRTMHQQTAKNDIRDLRFYLVSVLIGTAAVPLFLVADPIYGAAAVGLAAGSCFTTYRLLDDRRKLVRQKTMLESELVRAQKFATIDELSGGIAHEINNPLGIMGQEAEWIQHVFKSEALKDIKELDDCKDSLVEIVRQVDRCKEIVHKLLSLAKEMDPVIQCLDVNSLIENMTDIAEREAGPRNIKIVRRLQSDLPVVYSDPPLLRQVILNLLMNAAQAIERDGIITIVTATQDGKVCITIRDTGCGIPKEYIDRIFTPFFSTKKHGKGAGLGLAICRGIIERLGGYMSVASDVGKSTAFTIHLPLRRDGGGQIGNGKQTEDTHSG